MEDMDVSIVKEARTANRAAMPVIAAVVDELRALGLSPKVIFASENGHTVGRKPRDENVFEIPRGYRMETGNAPRRKG